MVLNEDILHGVTRFADRRTLATICLLSRATRWPATKLLYRSVRVHSLDGLGALDDALAQNRLLGPLVSEFLQDNSSERFEVRDAQLWVQRLPHRLESPLRRIIRHLVNLETVSLHDLGYCGGDTNNQLSMTLAALPRLRSVRVPDIGTANLTRIGALAHLEHVFFKDGFSDAIVDWLIAHAATLKSVWVVNSHMLLNQLATSPNKTVFPHLHSLALPLDCSPLDAGCSDTFPGLRSLTIHRFDHDLSTHWPRLQHLSFAIREEDPIMPLPPVQSVRLEFKGLFTDRLAQLHEWSAHHVRALVLSGFGDESFAVYTDVLRIYNHLRLLDLDIGWRDNNVGDWILRTAWLPVVPPSWEVLTLRGVTGDGSLTEETVNGLRVRAPSLKLVRVVSADGRQRRGARTDGRRLSTGAARARWSPTICRTGERQGRHGTIYAISELVHVLIPETLGSRVP